MYDSLLPPFPRVKKSAIQLPFQDHFQPPFKASQPAFIRPTQEEGGGGPLLLPVMMLAWARTGDDGLFDIKATRLSRSRTQ